MPAEIDIVLGRRLAELRQAQGLTRDHLAAALRTDADRIEAFESATQRMSVADLVRLAASLDVPIAMLFADLRDDTIVPFPSSPAVAEGHAIVAAFLRIRDARARSTLLRVAEFLASSPLCL